MGSVARRLDPSFPRRRESTGWGRSVIADLIRNPEGCGLGPSFQRRRESTGWGHDDHVIADLIRNPEGQGAGRFVILASRQYPQGGERRPRHCGLGPQSRGVRPGSFIPA